MPGPLSALSARRLYHSLTRGDRQITHFKGELIRDFDWSHDGKQVVVARGHLNSNVVLISNFH